MLGARTQSRQAIMGAPRTESGGRDGQGDVIDQEDASRILAISVGENL